MARCYTVALVILIVDCCYGLALTTGYNDQAAKIKELENTVFDLKRQLENVAYNGNQEKRGNTLPYNYNRNSGLTLRDQPVNNVAFSAVLADSTTLNKDDKLILKSIKANNGNAYNPTTGEFTAPVKGTYVFSLNIACTTGNWLEMSIIKGTDSVLFNSICNNNSDKEVHQNGGSTVALLDKGDQIHVEMIWPKYRSGTVAGEGLSSFSGFLLRAA